jgi:hypothetical protein
LNRTQVPGSPTPGNKCLTNSKEKLAKHIQSVHKNFKNQKENTTYLAPCFFLGVKALSKQQHQSFSLRQFATPHWVIPLPGLDPKKIWDCKRASDKITKKMVDVQ